MFRIKLKDLYYASALCVVLIVAPVSIAQTTSTLTGRIYEAGSNRPIPGVKVTITNEESGNSYVTVTDSAGDFRRPFLPPGIYNITCYFPGYESQTINVRVPLNSSVQVPPVYLRPNAKDGKVINYTTPPKLRIKSPEIINERQLILAADRFNITGQATSDSKIGFIIIQGNVVPVDEKGVFSANVSLQDGPNQITVTAIDIYGNWAKVEFSAIKEADNRGLGIKSQNVSRALGSRKYYALVIGNNKYENVPPLKTAVSDAEAIASILQEKYGFTTQLLLNASRGEIMTALNDYRRKLGESANLIIYYAGHGVYDSDVDKGYWIPVDAKLDDTGNWISADDVTTSIRQIPAKHILIISDSCYSGTLARDIDPKLVPCNFSS